MINPITRRKILKKGMLGRATITAMGAVERGASRFNLPMTLQVRVEGLAPYEVEDQWMVSRKDPLGFGLDVPVKVDRDDPNKVAIDWEQAREEAAAQKATRRAALAGQAPVTDPTQPVDPAAVGAMGAAAQGAAPVVDMRGDPELREKVEKLLGRSLTPGTSESVAENDPVMQAKIMRLVQEHTAQEATGSARGFSTGGSDDTLQQLERLNALRESGALTKKEFAAQKKRILGGG